MCSIQKCDIIDVRCNILKSESETYKAIYVCGCAWFEEENEIMTECQQKIKELREITGMNRRVLWGIWDPLQDSHWVGAWNEKCAKICSEVYGVLYSEWKSEERKWTGSFGELSRFWRR